MGIGLGTTAKISKSITMSRWMNLFSSDVEIDRWDSISSASIRSGFGTYPENTLHGLPGGLLDLHFLGIQQGSPDGLRHGGGRHRWRHGVVLATSSLEVKQRRVKLLRGDLTACAASAAALHGWFERRRRRRRRRLREVWRIIFLFFFY